MTSTKRSRTSNTSSKNSNPIAVLISDVHVNRQTLSVAIECLTRAVDKANELDVPLIVAGDLHDTKANVRGECISAMRETFKRAMRTPYVLVGNHDLINEKSKEHSLEFLEDLVKLIDCPERVTIDRGENSYGLMLIPYQNDADAARKALKDADCPVVMHQGILGSEAGHYFQDHSAINPEDVDGLLVYSGHYHRRQTITYGTGVFHYIGNPYTLTFAEATDPEKGFLVIYDDSTYDVVPTGQREHKVIETDLEGLRGEVVFLGDERDLVWVKIRGSSDELAKLTKKYVGEQLDISQPFRLDLIPNDTQVNTSINAVNVPQDVLLDGLIDTLSNTDVDRKERLKTLWKQFTTAKD